MTTSLSFSSGSSMPALGLGTWRAAAGEVGAAVSTALELGYRHIDAAAIYGNEAELGDALAGSGVPRDELWVTSKLWNDSHAAGDVRGACEKTLADLKLDVLDLYLIHWPVAQKPGVTIPESAADFVSLEEMPLAETWGAMEALVEAGLCRHIGVSNFSVKKLGGILDGARIKPVMNQVEAHPFLAQNELLAFCREHDVHLTAYAPLGSENRALLEDPVVGEIAARHDATPAQVLLAWGVQRGTSVIPKSVNRDRLAQNLAAGDLTLDDDAMTQLANLDRGRRFIDGSFWVHDGGPYTLANLWDE